MFRVLPDGGVGFGRQDLCYMAVVALDGLADECSGAPVPKSLLLRALLAWLYHEAGAEPAKRWIFTSFWLAVTSQHDEPEHARFLKSYERSTAAQASLNAICRELGWERTVSFMRETQDRRARRRT